MKDTHSVQGIEDLILEKLDTLKNGETVKEKREARRAIISLEKFYNDIQGKKINGKKYPIREMPPKTTKKELLELIDSVDTPKEIAYPISNLSGAYISSDRTTEFARTSILDLYNKE